MDFSPARLAAALDDCLSALEARPAGLCVALSGGLDSSVLLAALVASGAGRAVRLRAIHVDHGWHPDSAQWAGHCAARAAALNVPLAQVRVDARPARGESPEATARAARYSAVAASLEAGEVLVTAHHADDQLETILLQWLRGGGLRAVAGMRPISRFAAGWHARPMLGFTRAEIAAWAASAGLQWLEDPSNRDTRMDRNYLREDVLPAIRRRWPAAARTVGRVATQAIEALDMEARIARADLALASDGRALSLERLNLLPPVRRRWVFRAWLRSLELPVPSAATLAALGHDMAVSAGDRVPCVNWAGARVYRYRGRMYGISESSASATLQDQCWSSGDTIELGTLGSLEFRPAVGTGLSRERLPRRLRVSRRERGETFRPAGSAHHRPLRKWLQERGVLPWRRDQIPLLRYDGEVVAIGDLACASGYVAAPGEPSWTIAWRGRPLLTETDVLQAVPDAVERDTDE